MKRVSPSSASPLQSLWKSSLASALRVYGTCLSRPRSQRHASFSLMRCSVDEGLEISLENPLFACTMLLFVILCFVRFGFWIYSGLCFKGHQCHLSLHLPLVEFPDLLQFVIVFLHQGLMPLAVSEVLDSDKVGVKIWEDWGRCKMMGPCFACTPFTPKPGKTYSFPWKGGVGKMGPSVSWEGDALSTVTLLC